jgi:hypothetical protein
MVNNEIYDFDDDIETHFKSDEYKENMKEVSSLGNKKN